MQRRKLSRSLRIGVVGAGIAAALLPGSAEAESSALLQYDPYSNTLAYTGAAVAEAVSVDLSSDGRTVLFRSTAPYSISTTCSRDPLDARLTRCTPAAGAPRARVDVHLGGGGDTFTSHTNLDGLVVGGSGPDTFFRKDMPGPQYSSSLEFRGGDGTDEINYSVLGAGVTTALDDLDNDGLAGDTDNVRTDVEKFHGTVHADRFYGDYSSETFITRAGDDLVYADGGADTIRDDGGSDTLHGGQGNDYIVNDGPANLDRVFGSGGSDIIDGVNGYLTEIHCGEGGETDDDWAIADTSAIDFIDGDCEDKTRR